MTNPAIITRREAEMLLKAQKKGFAEVSLDLGKSKERVEIRYGMAVLRGQKVALSEIEKTKDNTCYVASENGLEAVETFSEDTNIYYKLRPTKDWPTIMLSSVPMHRFMKVTPKRSAQLMVKQVSPIKGLVLDTCCGLGYTAILAAEQRGCVGVETFERDENVLALAKYNSWSKPLFENTPKIRLHNADVGEEIRKLGKETFNCIIHDPPTVNFAPELYEAPFYHHLFRVLKSRGRLYHYAPAPGKTKGKEYWPSIIRKLTEAGFVGARYDVASSGVVARKK